MPCTALKNCQMQGMNRNRIKTTLLTDGPFPSDGKFDSSRAPGLQAVAAKLGSEGREVCVIGVRASLTSKQAKSPSASSL